MAHRSDRHLSLYTWTMRLAPSRDALVMPAGHRNERVPLRMLQRLNMEIDVESRPTEMISPGAFDREDVFYRCALEPRVPLVIQEIFFLLGEHPYSERRDACDLTSASDLPVYFFSKNRSPLNVVCSGSTTTSRTGASSTTPATTAASPASLARATARTACAASGRKTASPAP